MEKGGGLKQMKGVGMIALEGDEGMEDGQLVPRASQPLENWVQQLFQQQGKFGEMEGEREMWRGRMEGFMREVNRMTTAQVAEFLQKLQKGHMWWHV